VAPQYWASLSVWHEPSEAQQPAGQVATSLQPTQNPATHTGDVPVHSEQPAPAMPQYCESLSLWQ